MTTREVCVLIYIVVCVIWVIWKWREQCGEAQPVVTAPRERPKLRPRTPKSCAECQDEGGLEIELLRDVRPWNAVRSRRGRKKRIDTEGHACWNPGCDYYGITDARVHALVGYGHHGKKDRIQDLFC